MRSINIKDVAVPSCRGKLYENDPEDKTSRLRRHLPYGVWVCADGRQVLFNRDYAPIWERYPGKRVKQADPSEWVKGISYRYSFYYDGNPPHRAHEKGLGVYKAGCKASLARCEGILLNFILGTELDWDKLDHAWERE